MLQFPNFDCFIQSGNMNGDRPYIHVIGSTCSQCPSGYTLVTTGCAQINVSNVHAVISSLFVLAKN